MKNRAAGVAAIILTVWMGMTIGARMVPSQGQTSPPPLTPDQVEQVHSRLFGSSVRTLIDGKPVGEIPYQISKRFGDIFLKDYPGHRYSMGEGAHLGGDPKTRLESWVCESDLVIVGRAGTGTSHITGDKSFLYTDWRFVAEQVLENNKKAPVNPGASLTVVRPGGKLKVGDRMVYADEVTFSDFSSGEQYLLFLNFIQATGAYTAANHIYTVSGSKTVPLFRHDFREVEALDKDSVLQIVRNGTIPSAQSPKCKAGAQK